MGALRSVIEEWASVDLASCSDFELMSDLAEIEAGIGLLEAKRAERLVVFGQRRAYEADGAGSTVSWLVSECRMDPAAAAARVRVAKRLESLPATRAALAAGELAFDHVRAIASATSGIEIEAADEAYLVDQARSLNPKAFGAVATSWRHATDAQRCLDDANAVYARRTFAITDGLDGMGVLGGRLDAEGTATVATAVNALAAPVPGDDRSPGQCRADALVELCRRSLDGGGTELPLSGGERPHLNVTVSLENLECRAGVDAASLDWSGPIPGETARRLACDAGISRIITAGPSEPLDVGRRTRTIPAALRRAVIARDRHCVEPGCDAPADWCDVHHIVHWIDGGETKLSNLELRCRRDHRKEHEGKADVGNRAPP